MGAKDAPLNEASTDQWFVAWPNEDPTGAADRPSQGCMTLLAGPY
jgi:hypothetical protein